ncbi:DUF559 domain-containing protein [Bradyrhizobium elkanii]|uniref:DUF559 domain-containing protein n=1 Tax=Bradyrhizobium elkanii TaxID=29448 RepID=UPI003BACFD44
MKAGASRMNFLPRLHSREDCAPLYPPLEGEGRSRVQSGWGEATQMVSTPIRRAAAKKLRTNTTPHERILWRALREQPTDGTHFRRPSSISSTRPSDSSSSWTVDTTTTMKRRSAIVRDKSGSSGKDIASSGSGIRRSVRI